MKFNAKFAGVFASEILRKIYVQIAQRGENGVCLGVQKARFFVRAYAKNSAALIQKYAAHGGVG